MLNKQSSASLNPKPNTIHTKMPAIDSDVLIFGAGSHARKVARALIERGHRVLGFVSSRVEPDTLDTLPVHCWHSLKELKYPSNTQVLCAIFNRNDPYTELLALVNRHGFDRVLMPWEYYPELEKDLGWCYWLYPETITALNDIESSQSYQHVIKLLKDDESKETFRRIHAFRRGTDLAFSGSISTDPQYFNNFTLAPLAERSSITYVDVGAYNGDTLRSLTSFTKIDRAILFEPEASNYAALQINLKDLFNQNSRMKIEALPLALGSVNQFVQISGQGEAASLHSAADSLDARLIHMVRGDDLFPWATVDFIKVDAEGADLDALLGITQLIRRSSPVLAISIYHRPNDITEIPIAISNILDGLDYSYFIRQHMFNSFDSVFYAVPFL